MQWFNNLKPSLKAVVAIFAITSVIILVICVVITIIMLTTPKTLPPATTEPPLLPVKITSSKGSISVDSVVALDAVTFKGKPVENYKGRWIAVYFTYENDTKDMQEVEKYDIDLYVDGKSYSLNGDATGGLGLEQGIKSTLAGINGLQFKPGESYRTVAVFDCPAEYSLLSFKFGSEKSLLPLAAPPTPTPTPAPTNTPTITPTPTSTPTPGPTNTPTITPTPRPTSTPVLGLSRSAPIPMGTPEGYKGEDIITVTKLIRPADREVASYNPYNEKPEDGQEWVIVMLSCGCQASADKTCKFNTLDYRIVGSKGKIYGWKGTVVPDKYSAQQEIFGGASTEIMLTFIVDKDDRDLVLILDPGTGYRAKYFEVK